MCIIGFYQYSYGIIHKVTLNRKLSVKISATVRLPFVFVFEKKLIFYLMIFKTKDTL